MKSKFKTTRRRFIANSALAAGGLTVGLNTLSSPASASVLGANDKVRVGFIGVGNRGTQLMHRFMENDEVEVAGLCDVYEPYTSRDRSAVAKRYLEIGKVPEMGESFKNQPKRYKDFREMLDQKDIDAVVIATPDHWHAVQTIMALEAGKDVYVEKPLANFIEECNLMAKAAERYNRIIQVGQQQRSGLIWNNVMNYIKSGKLGTLSKVNIWGNFDYGAGQPKQPDTSVPAGVDYDFWLGPAPERSFNPTRYHGSWRHFWDYGGGLMTDWGVHLIDMALWAKDITDEPTEVMAYGGNWTYLDHSRETFGTMSVVYPMKDYVITWNHAIAGETGPYNMTYGVEFIGDKGTIVADRSKWMIFSEGESMTNDSSGDLGDMDFHVRDFLESIKTRNKPNCPIEVGRNVALYAHMGNIAVRSGAGKLVWDAGKGEFNNSKAANDYLVPEYRDPWKLPKV